MHKLQQIYLQIYKLVKKSLKRPHKTWKKLLSVGRKVYFFMKFTFLLRSTAAYGSDFRVKTAIH